MIYLQAEPMQIETIGSAHAAASSNAQSAVTAQKSRPDVKSDESSAVLLPAGAEALKMRARYLNLSDVTKAMNKKEGDQFMSATVRRLLKTGKSSECCLCIEDSQSQH